MILFTNALWVFLSTYLLPLFRSVFIYIFRLYSVRSFQNENLKTSTASSPENSQVERNDTEPEPERENEKGEEESYKFFPSFKFPTYEEFREFSADSKDDGFLPEKEFMPQIMEFGAVEEGFQVNQELDESVPSGENSVDSESISSSCEFPAMSPSIDSYIEGFLSDGDFISDAEEIHTQDSDTGPTGRDAHDLEEEDIDITDDSKTLQEPEFLTEMDFCEGKNETEEDELDERNGLADCEKEQEGSYGLESLWEHQDLIERLEIELSKGRATGLPTILEEDESPKIMEDLHPWKMKKLQPENKMGDLHKFYRSYRERMRKLDVLNYQKMFAIGFLQSKNPVELIPVHKSSTPRVRSFLMNNFRLCRSGKIISDPIVKFVGDLQCDLETVYVGQMCLSWEFLHWQYEKTLELWDSHHLRLQRYNEVAGKFQQFQVLVQRFIENEPFQGPRVKNFVKSRRVLRNLLQVPVIKEDRKIYKKERGRGRSDHEITIDKLIEAMEESIRVFWRFVQADRYRGNAVPKGWKECQSVKLQDPANEELFLELQIVLYKKEKRLRDLLRTENCMLRKFQKHHQEDSSDYVLYFFSQVDMNLVGRVLSMSRVTLDQLIWCRNKLERINYINRKIHVEPGFLLFPC